MALYLLQRPTPALCQVRRQSRGHPADGSAIRSPRLVFALVFGCAIWISGTRSAGGRVLRNLRSKISGTGDPDRATTRVANHSALVTLQDSSHHVASFQGFSSLFYANQGCACAHQRRVACFSVQNNPQDDKINVQMPSGRSRQ